jgi:hypothetical protein
MNTIDKILKLPAGMRPYVEKILGYPLEKIRTRECIRKWNIFALGYFTIGTSSFDKLDDLITFAEIIVGYGDNIWWNFGFETIRNLCERCLIIDYAYNVVLIQRTDLPEGLRNLHANIERHKFSEAHKKLLALGLAEKDWGIYFERAEKYTPRIPKFF